MKLHSFRYNYQRLIQQVAIVVTACVCLASLAEAASVKTTKDNLPGNLSSKNILIAQETNTCPEGSGGSLFVSAETRRFLIYICGGDNPNTYVGIAKNGGQGINVPLKSYNRNQFVAVNGDTTYTLTRTELIVRQKGRIILRERATWKR